MKVLTFVPQSRRLAAAINSIVGLEWAGEMTTVFMRGGDDPEAHRFANITRKSQIGRQMALDGGYDALLLVDDDQIVPADALKKLARLESDIAYGLTVWRNEPYWWSAAVEIDEPNHHVQVNAWPDMARAAWGKVIEVKGVGSFCTLIRREALEKLPFERRGVHCFDYYLAVDAQKHGLRQVCDTSVLVGHIDAGIVRWPTVDGHRVEMVDGLRVG